MRIFNKRVQEAGFHVNGSKRYTKEWVDSGRGGWYLARYIVARPIRRDGEFPGVWKSGHAKPRTPSVWELDRHEKILTRLPGSRNLGFDTWSSSSLSM